MRSPPRYHQPESRGNCMTSRLLLVVLGLIGTASAHAQDVAVYTTEELFEMQKYRSAELVGTYYLSKPYSAYAEASYYMVLRSDGTYQSGEHIPGCTSSTSACYSRVTNRYLGHWFIVKPGTGRFLCTAYEDPYYYKQHQSCDSITQIAEGSTPMKLLDDEGTERTHYRGPDWESIRTTTY